MKKLLIVLVVAILILAGIGFLYFFLNTEPKCEDLETLEQRDSCYMQSAVKNSEVEICDNIKNNLLLANCYKTIAVNTEDNYVCQAISTSDDNLQTVRRDCFTDVAIKTKDASSCQYIPADDTGDLGVRDYCYVMVAVEKRDSSICDVMSGDYASKEDCIKRANAGSNEV